MHYKINQRNNQPARTSYNEITQSNYNLPVLVHILFHERHMVKTLGAALVESVQTKPQASQK